MAKVIVLTLTLLFATINANAAPTCTSPWTSTHDGSALFEPGFYREPYNAIIEIVRRDGDEWVVRNISGRAVRSGRLPVSAPVGVWGRLPDECGAAYAERTCTPYGPSPCWDDPVSPAPVPAPAVFRVGQRYTGPYGWRMRVLAVLSDAGREVVTGVWLVAPNNQQTGDVFAFVNGTSNGWVVY